MTCVVQVILVSSRYWQTKSLHNNQTKPSPPECISHISVKGHQRERTGLFFFFSNALIKNRVF